MTVIPPFITRRRRQMTPAEKIEAALARATGPQPTVTYPLPAAPSVIFERTGEHPYPDWPPAAARPSFTPAQPAQTGPQAVLTGTGPLPIARPYAPQARRLVQRPPGMTRLQAIYADKEALFWFRGVLRSQGWHGLLSDQIMPVPPIAGDGWDAAMDAIAAAADSAMREVLAQLSMFAETEYRRALAADASHLMRRETAR